MSGRSRDAFEDVGRAIRLALERAAAARLPRSSHLTLEAIVAVVGSYSRLEDNVSVDQLARFSGLHPKTVEKALRQLRDLGIATYRGGRGRGNVSTIGFPASVERGAARGSPFATERGAVSNGKGSRPGRKGESLRLPTREVFREDSRGSGGARGASPLLDEECMDCGVRRGCRDDGERILCSDCAEAVPC